MEKLDAIKDKIKTFNIIDLLKKSIVKFFFAELMRIL